MTIRRVQVAYMSDTVRTLLFYTKKVILINNQPWKNDLLETSFKTVSLNNVSSTDLSLL